MSFASRSHFELLLEESLDCELSQASAADMTVRLVGSGFVDVGQSEARCGGGVVIRFKAEAEAEAEAEACQYY